MKLYPHLKRHLKSNKVKAVVFLAIFVFTFILRAHNYDRTPPMGHLEELMYAWAGMNLIERGVPVAWTSLDYPDSATYYKGRLTYNGGKPYVFVKLVQPWLDQPPLFSLITGETAHLFKANRNSVIPTSIIRMPTVIFAAVTSVFIFLIARFISGYWIGVLSMLIYGVTPIMVIASRMAVPENLISMVYVIIIYLLLKFQSRQNIWLIITIPILVGIAGLSKATGFLIIFLAIYVLWSKKWYKGALYLFLATLPFVGLFFAYGLHYSPEIFWRISTIQSFRPIGFSSLAWIFSSPGYDIVEFIDSWFIFFMLVAAYFMFAPVEGYKKFIIFTFIYWIIVVMMSGGERDMLPWYRFPAYPLLAIIGAWGLQMLVEKADYFASFLIIGFLLGNRYLLVNAFRPNVSPSNYRLVFSFLMVPSLIYTIYQKHWLTYLSRTILVGVIIVGIYFNSVYIYTSFGIECESITCPIGPSNALSMLHFPDISKLLVLGSWK